MLVEYAYLQSGNKPIDWGCLKETFCIDDDPRSDLVLSVEGDTLFISLFPEPGHITHISFAWLKKKESGIRDLLCKFSSHINLPLHCH